jgi:hypothetical protein
MCETKLLADFDKLTGVHHRYLTSRSASPRIELLIKHYAAAALKGDIGAAEALLLSNNLH